ncbi:GNAT family N-acetyltransferase [Listeria booriae]|uniref:GNAT family N-acetyltransferase n=1 Tax=Listeria booriae TaxID=1552123 RepID=A0A7X1DHC0_9LIST|nr:GNAT family protein [Listeria booriae]MBC2282784.1 GNAT family N-acetyltransferase [Listeria booriae]MBC2292518.1 GNAT family N-acetyltransferase [Listeria booriae]MBC2305027.1 GNAT family N-acetyltransferase [Listeria booriae]MBC2310242.1 GNAT family N-acetyltransferase [Listeria booriae]
MIQVREACEYDAKRFAKMQLQIDGETDYMLYGAGEREISTKDAKKRLEYFADLPYSIILVAEDMETESLVGFLIADGNPPNRMQHSIYIAVGVLKDYWGQGVATRLFEHMETWARSRGVVRRIELGVLCENQKALRLYQKLGYEIEGTHRDSFMIGNEYYDTYWLSKLI